MEWYFQFTPHDTHDWDAQEPLLLVDEEWRGKPRKLLVQANRNGFLYVLDRETGEFLMGEAFAKQTWASGFSGEGRPTVIPGSDPTEEGVVTCPAIRGATNWMASAYNPATKLFYLLVHESCNEYRKADRPWEAGQRLAGWHVQALARPREPQVHPSPRHPVRQDCLGVCADGQGADLLGRALDGRRGWCSLARTAGRSRRSTQRRASRSGTSKRIKIGRRRR